MAQIILNLTTDSSDFVQDLWTFVSAIHITDKQVTESRSRNKLVLEVTEPASKTRNFHQDAAL